MRYEQLAACERDPTQPLLGLRVAFLLQLNEWLGAALRVADLGLPSALSPFAAVFRHPHVRRLTFASVKTKAVQKALLDTAVPPVEQHQ